MLCRVHRNRFGSWPKKRLIMRSATPAKRKTRRAEPRNTKAAPPADLVVGSFASGIRSQIFKRKSADQLAHHLGDALSDHILNHLPQLCVSQTWIRLSQQLQVFEHFGGKLESQNAIHRLVVIEPYRDRELYRHRRSLLHVHRESREQKAEPVTIALCSGDGHHTL